MNIFLDEIYQLLRRRQLCYKFVGDYKISKGVFDFYQQWFVFKCEKYTYHYFCYKYHYKYMLQVWLRNITLIDLVIQNIGLANVMYFKWWQTCN